MTYHCINWVRHTLNKNNKTWRTLYDISLTITPISAVTAQHTIYMVDRRYRISSSACHNSPDSADNTALQWGHSADICSYNEGTVLISVPTMRAQCWHLRRCRGCYWQHTPACRHTPCPLSAKTWYSAHYKGVGPVALLFRIVSRSGVVWSLLWSKCQICSRLSWSLTRLWSLCRFMLRL